MKIDIKIDEEGNKVAKIEGLGYFTGIQLSLIMAFLLFAIPALIIVVGPLFFTNKKDNI